MPDPDKTAVQFERFLPSDDNFSPLVLRNLSESSITTASLAQSICLSILQSAQMARQEIARLLDAYDRPSDRDCIAHSVQILAQHTFALEILELGLSSDAVPYVELQLSMKESIKRLMTEGKLGPEFNSGYQLVLDELAAAVTLGRNGYDCAAQSYFSRLGIGESPKEHLPRGTWLHYWAESFLHNSRVVSTYLNCFVVKGDLWYKESVSIYEPYIHQHSTNAVLCIEDNPPGAMLNRGLLKLVAVCLGGDKWLYRPSLREKVKPTTPGILLMSVIDLGLAKAAWTKLLAHCGNDRYAEMIFAALDEFNFNLIIGPDLFPDTSIRGDQDLLDASREALLRNASPGDIIFTALPRVYLSRFISRLDSGAWSHVLVVSGDGKVVDAQIDGVTEQDINGYLTGIHRFALCRMHIPNCSSARRTWMREITIRGERGRIGQSYNWLGALRAAFHSWRRLQVPEEYLTPNGLAYRGQLRPLVVW